MGWETLFGAEHHGSRDLPRALLASKHHRVQSAPDTRDNVTISRSNPRKSIQSCFKSDPCSLLRDCLSRSRIRLTQSESSRPSSGLRFRLLCDIPELFPPCSTSVLRCTCEASFPSSHRRWGRDQHRENTRSFELRPTWPPSTSHPGNPLCLSLL